VDGDPAALQALALGLARQPRLVDFARGLAERRDDRLARIAAVFTFVNQLVRMPRKAGEPLRDGLDQLLELAGEARGSAVILGALLMALGERAGIESAGDAAFVRVAIDSEDVRRLPPHACPYPGRGCVYLPIDPLAGFRASRAGETRLGRKAKAQHHISTL
jgi:hypothetical protein